MLPLAAPLCRRAVAAAVALALTLPAAAPAMADGRDTRNFLKGVAAAVIVGAIINEAGKAKARERDPYPYGHGAGYGPTYGHDRRPAPVYTPPAPAYHSALALAFAEYSPASKRAIQARLRAYGYYRGAIDGAYGPATRAAIEAYARDTGNTRALTSRDGTVTLLNGLLV